MTALKTSLSVLLLFFVVICCKKSPVEVSYVSLNTNSIEIVEGDTYTLTASISPENAEYDDITWKSSNSTVASVSQGIVTANQEGETTISATAGGKSAICNVTVSAKLIPVTSITIDKGDLFYIAVGETSSLSAQTSPSDANEYMFFWTSSDDTVVKVDNNGKITGVKAGTATLTFTATASGTSASCDVTVVSPNNIIYYTPTNDWVYSIYAPKEVTPYNSYAFGSNIIYNKCYPDDIAGGRIIFDGPVTSIGTYAFKNCRTLETIELPATVSEIGEEAFYATARLKSIKLPETVATIGKNAFYLCSCLVDINCPKELKTIGHYAFFGTENLTEFTFGPSIQSIGVGAFEFSGLKEATIWGNTVLEIYEYIGGRNFLDCKSLKSVEFKDGFAELPKDVFTGCTKLTDVTLPSSLMKFADGFKECISLTNVYLRATLPPSVTYITSGEKLFCDSNSVTVWVPNESVDAYKEASGWSDVADKIKGYDY